MYNNKYKDVWWAFGHTAAQYWLIERDSIVIIFCSNVNLMWFWVMTERPFMSQLLPKKINMMQWL